MRKKRISFGKNDAPTHFGTSSPPLSAVSFVSLQSTRWFSRAQFFLTIPGLPRSNFSNLLTRIIMNFLYLICCLVFHFVLGKESKGPKVTDIVSMLCCQPSQMTFALTLIPPLFDQRFTLISPSVVSLLVGSRLDSLEKQFPKQVCINFTRILTS